MKPQKGYYSTLSSISAFVIGVILFVVFWKMLFGSASSPVILAGIAGTAIAVIMFWLRNQIQHHTDKEK